MGVERLICSSILRRYASTCHRWQRSNASCLREWVYRISGKRLETAPPLGTLALLAPSCRSRSPLSGQVGTPSKALLRSQKYRGCRAGGVAVGKPERQGSERLSTAYQQDVDKGRFA